ncbi:MAG: peroxiredoxin [Alphaproteobacteria bacterium]|nr:peroxiredoxin [Alphaproteobacteria bacterium]
MLKLGQTAPLFSLQSDEGEKISLADLKGKNVVLYFYPKDDTPGCTIEAQDFTKRIKDFEKLNCVILGVSRDEVASHCRFSEKYNLAFNLLADESGETCKAYDVIKEKSMFGKKYLGIDRSTFLIDRLGKIAHFWCCVNVKGHVDEVLTTLTEIERRS